MGLSQEPRLLILDEPTQGLADSEIADFIELIRNLVGEMTILLIEHNINVVMQTADAITVLNSGQVLAEGTPDAIRANAAVQRPIWGQADAECKRIVVRLSGSTGASRCLLLESARLSAFLGATAPAKAPGRTTRSRSTTSGRVECGGVEVSRLPADAWYHANGSHYTPQGRRLFVSFDSRGKSGNRPDGQPRGHTRNMSGDVRGFRAVLHQRADTLSGGEQQNAGHRPQRVSNPSCRCWTNRPRGCNPR